MKLSDAGRNTDLPKKLLWLAMGRSEFGTARKAVSSRRTPKGAALLCRPCLGAPRLCGEDDRMPDWPHSPVHRLGAAGAYMVTAGTYQKQHYFRTADRLSMLQDQLVSLANQYGWKLQAWAVFSNHYHFVTLSPDEPGSLRRMIGHLHTLTAQEVNRLDGIDGRKVWYEYWDTHLTYERSYLARLHYVHQNPVRHGLVKVANAYPWCSAGWFEQQVTPAVYKVVTSFKIDRVNVPDAFEVERIDPG
jgi:putative transposase